MITIFAILFFAALTSFVGSLQLGPVNLFVINTVLYSGRREALWVALGGSLPEFLYCALAVFANHFLEEYALVQLIFRIAFVLILIGIGFRFLLKKTISVEHIAEQHAQISSPLRLTLKGFSLAALNPQLLPFWIFVQVYFNSFPVLSIQSTAQKISFILGAGIGAFFLLFTATQLVYRYKTKLLNYATNKYYFKILAVLFFAIAIQQIIAFFFP